MKEIRTATINPGDPAGTSDLILIGQPIVFDTPAVIGGQYTEVVKRGALDNTDMSDCRLLYNHDLSKVPLAKTPKTMQLTVSPAGLQMKAQLPDTEEARSVHTAVKRGDLSGMSFSFTVPPGGDSYDAATNTRTINKIAKIYECSICPWPAYSQTSVEARSIMETAKQKIGQIDQMKIKINQILKRGI
ncbi:hypothetical protein SPSIL_020040 [Sporomusa silvacetica DSM 10669]|uniref:Prohead serine protease domain-containing protein n=1 Tax=Sporomusa silvacetica DSM 10669 TaxID=1123289 RepID=A0ABZ3IJL0_9FIRM|nr:HK97 family phage prohead protease [Sporomusa silvacetica]OZC18743.1 caudovirus prohead protease [Sporomusa silvacetica DSM 10669]